MESLSEKYRAEFWEGMRETKERMRETDRQIKELKEQMKETDKRMNGRDGCNYGNASGYGYTCAR